MIVALLQQAGTSGKADATLFAALVAASAAVIGTIVTIAIAIMQRSAQVRDAARALTLKQLNELYGPLFMLRTTSRQLRDRIGPNDGTWRLVDHISEIQSDPTKSRIVEEILRISGTISRLLEGQAGLLIDFPPPKSFEEFLPHARLLAMSWDAGEDQDPTSRFPFPDAFDDNVADAVRRLKERLART